MSVSIKLRRGDNMRRVVTERVLAAINLSPARVLLYLRIPNMFHWVRFKALPAAYANRDTQFLSC